MITMRHRIKLIAFLAIAVVSVSYVAVNYAGFGNLFGGGGYKVTARLGKPGGIFVGAEVTYRGVAVGSVSDMSLTDDGVAVQLSIKPDAPPVPAGTAAAVANRSPIGEQYVDLRPPDDSGPYLSGGEVIPNERTSVPVPSSKVLLNLNKLVNSISKEALRTIVDEAYKAFAGSGDDLQALLDTASSFSKTALEHSPETQQLLSDARTVLRTQLANSDNIKNMATGFAKITEQLKSSDPDLRTIVNEAPGLSHEVRSFLAKSGSDMGVLLANLLTTARITSKRTGSFETLLIGLPIVSAQSKSRAPGGNTQLGVVLNFFNPPSCTKGYDTDQRPATDLSVGKVNLDAYCAEPSGSQTGVRGAQNAPYAGKPVKVPTQHSSDDPAGKQAGTGKNSSDQGKLPGMLGMSTQGVLPDSVTGLLGVGG